MSRLKQSYKKLLIILLSRFKKTKKAQWIEDRKKECDKCPFNTKNMDKLPFTKSFVKNISDFYSFTELACIILRMNRFNSFPARTFLFQQDIQP